MDSEEEEEEMLDIDMSDAEFEDYSSGDAAVQFSDDNDNDYEGSYTVLKIEEIRQQQEDDITTISSVLSLSREAAGILLRHYHWSVDNAQEAWFADQDRVRKAVGLLEQPSVRLIPKGKKTVCSICFDSSYGGEDVSSADCGHRFCNTCWRAYMRISIADGPRCLMLRCPEPSCRVAVGQDLINRLLSDDDHEYKKKYAHFVVRSYVEDRRRKAKWCPAPGCECAVEFVRGSSGAGYDVTCLCSHKFCWNCGEEAHRPVACGTVAKWVLKNNSEGENVTWMMANSKQCPECKRPIEKNQGCMHMTCSQCRHEFCWLCLADWGCHGGSFYSCNRYEKARQEGKYDDEEMRRKMAKESLDRYTHYYDRWAENERSRKKALADLEGLQAGGHLDKLRDKLSDMPLSQLEFIREAWLQIVECRRVLEWTYAYGYYIPEGENTEKQFFEYVQGEAEAHLDRLHQCAENDLDPLLKEKVVNPSDFRDFQTKLAWLTSVTRNHFERLVRALESGLSEVAKDHRRNKKVSIELHGLD